MLRIAIPSIPHVHAPSNLAISTTAAQLSPLFRIKHRPPRSQRAFPNPTKQHPGARRCYCRRRPLPVSWTTTFCRPFASYLPSTAALPAPCATSAARPIYQATAAVPAAAALAATALAATPSRHSRASRRSRGATPFTPAFLPPPPLCGATPRMRAPQRRPRQRRQATEVRTTTAPPSCGAAVLFRGRVRRPKIENRWPPGRSGP